MIDPSIHRRTLFSYPPLDLFVYYGILLATYALSQ